MNNEHGFTIYEVGTNPVDWVLHKSKIIHPYSIFKRTNSFRIKLRILDYLKDKLQVITSCIGCILQLYL